MHIPKNKKATYMPNYGHQLELSSMFSLFPFSVHQFIGEQQNWRDWVARCLRSQVRRMSPDFSDKAIPALILHFRPIHGTQSKGATHMNPSRRKMLKYSSFSLAMIPALAFAAKNEGMRTTMKYKDTPEGDKNCANCVQFVEPNGCKLFPGDTEVSPKGYCVAWAKKG